MLEAVPLKPKSPDRYAATLGDEAVERLRDAAAPLRGARVLHINATAYGGGVAELLSSEVALMRGLGIDADWQVMYGSDEFFNVTKSMHNALQGMEVGWTAQMEKTYLDKCRENVQRLDTDYDYIVVHDPQPAAFLHLLESERQTLPRGKWIWRCHIDTSAPFAQVADFLFPFVEPYDAAVFTMADFVPGDYRLPRVELIPPCIDPRSVKNVHLTDETVTAILESYDIDPERPLLVQISRFDPWKDPLGVIDAYRQVKAQIPEVQLVLAGSMASDDPEGMHYLDRTQRHAGDDPDVFILTNAQQVGAIEVNAFQAGADVVIQKSLREGFGLTVSEALWKRTPVVAGDVGGIRMQVLGGENGYLVDSAERCADACLQILGDPEMAARMGDHGHDHVQANFVTTRKLEHYFELFRRLDGTD